MPTNARVNVQKDNVTDALSSSVVVPTGEALTIASGGSLTAEAGSIVNIPASGITGLGTMATQNANAVAITGGSITGITDLAVADGGTGTSSLTGYVKGAGTTPLTASSTIPNTDITGLGTMSTQNASSVAITGGSITGITDLAVADGGTGASNAADARVNLGVSTTGTSILYGDGAGSFSNVTIGSGVSFTSGTLSATGTGGTVTTVSVTPANGVSGTVANPTTTPAISLSLGDITPTTVNSVTLSGSATPNLAVTGTSTISGTNTGDQTISITGDVTAAGSQNTLTSTVTKINGQALATLATGILKNTTTTGVPSIAVAADFPTLNQNTTGNAATATNVAVTGVTGLGTGVASFLQTPTSANLSSMVTDETGTGDLVFANSPVLITPHLDTPSVLTLTNATGLPLSTGVTGTLPVANGGTGVTTSTGTGSVVLSASPTLTGIPAAPTAAVGTNTTQIATTQYVQANRGDKYLTTSTSTNTIDNGANKTFNCATDLSYIPTQAVTIVYDINNHMHATVITYNILTGVMVVDADAHTGSGTYSAWTINLGGLTSAGGALLSANNLSDVASAATSRANLGVTATGQDTTYLYRANNLSDLSSVTTARTNLGLGTMATQNSSSVSISGGTVDNVTLVTPTISSIINTGTLTLPNQTDTLVGRATTDVLTNKTLTSPVMTTPSLGVASATSINKVAITAPATGATLTIADGATLTASATATVSGTNTGDQTISITGDVTASGSTGVLTSTVTKVNGTSLAGLATGILKNTTGTGVPSIAVSGSDYAPATSGNSILYGNGAGGFSNVTIGSGVDFTGGTLSASGTGGTVTSVSVTTANGVSGTVTNPTTTPAISLTLGAITPTSVTTTTPIAGTSGGTGVNNGANTITIAGNVTHAGAFTQSFTATANTSLTLPVTGTLATLAGSEALSNKTITASPISGSTGAFTTLSATGVASFLGLKAQKATATSGFISAIDEGANVYNVLGSRNNADSAYLPMVIRGTTVTLGATSDIATISSAGLAVTGALTTTGSVGIGTSSAAAKLHVVDTTSSVALLESSGAATTASAYTVLKANSGSVAGNYYRAILGQDESNNYNWGIGNFGCAKDVLAFYSGGLTERMRIDVAGNVGIGTTSPSAKLDVRTAAGTAAAINLYAGSNATTSKLSIGQIGSIDWDLGVTTTNGWFQIGGLGGTMAQAYTIARSGTGVLAHTFYTGGAARAEISSAGLAVTGALSATGNILGSGTYVGISSPTYPLTQSNGIGSAFRSFAGTDIYGVDFRRWTGTATEHSVAYIGQYPNAVGGYSIGIYYDAAKATNTQATTRIVSIDQLGMAVTGQITATGNVGIGTTSPNQLLHIEKSQNSLTGINIYNANAGASAQAGVFLRNVSSGSASGGGAFLVLDVGNNVSLINQFGNPVIFGTNGTERMRIDGSGNVGIGTSSPSSSKLVIESNGTTFGTYGSTINLTAASGTRYHILFRENGTERGSITSNGTTVAYNSVSDYRLKDITGSLTDSGTFIDALKPKVGTWKSDGSKFVGFLAHEFAEVSPSSVTGEKDAVEEDGKPKYQTMQASSAEVIANLVAELQSVRQRLAALESK